MNTRALCEALLKEACDENASFYRKMIEDEPLDAVKDELWRKVIALARSLSPEQRETLLAFSRQSAVDAVSTFCGGIDGSSSLDGRFVSMTLTDADGQQHAGGLQEIFLELAYRK